MMPKAFRHPVYDLTAAPPSLRSKGGHLRKRLQVRDPRAGVLSDWFGIENSGALVLASLYERPATQADLARRTGIKPTNIAPTMTRLRLAGVDMPFIPRTRGASQYELTPTTRAEVQQAYRHAARLLEPGLLEAADERIAELEEALGLTWESPLEWNLTTQENRFVGILMRTKVASRERIMLALYPNEADRANPKIIDVYACKARAKTKPFGVDIRNKWGVGYYLAETEKAA